MTSQTLKLEIQNYHPDAIIKRILDFVQLFFFIIDNGCSQSEDPNFKKNENELLTVQI